MLRWIGLLAAGCVSAMGLGGGGILLLVLGLSGMAQRQAQGVNLLMLIPVGLTGLWFHRKNGYLNRKALRAMLAGGLPGAAAGLMLAGRIPEKGLRAAFGILLCVMAVRELRAGWSEGKKEGWRLFPEKNGE